MLHPTAMDMGGHSQRLPQKVQAANLGFPRIGPNRELKFATEKYWQHELDQAALEHTAQTLRAANWRLQRDLRVGVIPSNDFSLYDHVLDMTALLGAVPARFGWRGGAVDLDTYFAMARGRPEAPAMEMTKWFDTNYHYIVPEFTPEQRFVLATDKPVREFREAQALGIHTRPVLLGPVTYLLLGKAKGAQFDPLRLLDRLLPVYEALLAELAQAGADWVQMDEPYLALELSEAARAAYGTAYRRLGRATQIMLTTYFAAVDESWATVASLPVAGLHIDLVRAPAQLEAVLAALGDEQVLSLGLIDGRNVWRADLDYALALVQQAQARVGRARLQVAPSCSLLHCPLDLDREQQLAPDLKRWLAFAVQKLQEVTLLALAANGAPDLAAWSAARHALASRDSSPRVHNAAVHQRVAALTPAMRQRAPTHERRQAQAQALALPLFPTTTIGSFPQTAELRRVRAAWRRGTLTTSAYEQLLRTQIADVIHWQEAIGLDVLVHGEFERNDMVEYFAERLEGFAFTTHGWVQSYGSRYVKPPIIFGDVWRPQPMTLQWLAYAQSLTPRPVKGMLTGPVTMLHWSFVRDDQPLADTACQIALALRDEVQDLEAAGLRLIQVDEPAFREGLPLRVADRAAYLDWAVDAFRLCTACMQPATQIQTHMCYAEFQDILDAIVALDADVLLIETARSDMELLDAFTAYHYPNPIGPGVYDIHSPRIPPVDEMVALLRKAARVLAPEQVWVNPDCGLKTRRWEEVRPALGAMVQAARTLRQDYAQVRVRLYLQSAGLDPAQDALVQVVARQIEDVRERTASHRSPLAEDQLYAYWVPAPSPDESCSVAAAPDAQQPALYDLAAVLGGRKASTTQKLAVLNELVRQALQGTAVDWLGIYQARTKADGARVLVKLAYQGALSRAEFPLTPEWAARSNNSAVGLSGKARVINDVPTYVARGGSYFTCDPKVVAEACLPVFATGSSEVIGVIDAEAWRKDCFTDDTLAPLLALGLLAPEWLP